MWLWAKGPLWKPQSHEVNQTWLFGSLFHQEALHMANVVQITFCHKHKNNQIYKIS